MSANVVKHGVIVTLQELSTTSPYRLDGASLRVTGRLQEYNVEASLAIIVDEGSSLKIDAQHLRDLNMRLGSLYQFIGELHIDSDNVATLQDRVGRNVDGIDLPLYYQTVLLHRSFESKSADDGEDKSKSFSEGNCVYRC